MEEKKYYISSDGTKKDIKEMNTQYLINAVNKKRNSLFECESYDEIKKALDQIEMLDQEYYERVKQFLESKENEIEGAE